MPADAVLVTFYGPDKLREEYRKELENWANAVDSPVGKPKKKEKIRNYLNVGDVLVILLPHKMVLFTERSRTSECLYCSPTRSGGLLQDTLRLVEAGLQTAGGRGSCHILRTRATSHGISSGNGTLLFCCT